MAKLGGAVRLVRAVRNLPHSLWLGRQLREYPEFGYRPLGKTGLINVRLYSNGYYVRCTVTAEDGSTEDFEAQHPLEAARRQVESRLLAAEGWRMITPWKVDSRNEDGNDVGMWARFAPIMDR